MEFYKRKNCRLCNSTNLEKVLDLNQSALCDEYLKSTKTQKQYDLKLDYCLNCNFVQINTVINPEIIYKNYIYVTSSSLGLVEHFEKYCQEVLNVVSLNKNKLVIDIGSNEGILLKAFKKNDYKVLGIEPSIKAANISNKNGIETLCTFFNKKEALKILEKYGKASIVTINNLLANIDDLEDFIEAILIILDTNGVIIIESSYLLDMIDNMVFDYIYHEHLSYFSILPLIKFFKKYNMKLINLQKIDTKGGSMRYFITKESSNRSINSNVEKFIKEEKKYNLNPARFKKYSDEIQKQKVKLINFLEKNIDYEIIGFGASATSTTLITHYNLNNFLDYLVDENIAKVGTYSPGFNIPVYDIEKLNKENNKPKIIIILAWRYYKDILPKINKSHQDKVVIPLPYFKEL